LEDPSPEEAAAAINTGFKLGVAVVYGLCEGEYSGRAAARLEPAYRVVMIKRDGTLLVHEAEKREPVIWNPPPSTTMARAEAGNLVITSVRSRPLETVVIRFPVVRLVAILPASARPPRVEGTERDMVEAIARDPTIVEDGLSIVGREVPSDVGKIDILARDREGRLVVIEVKRGLASHEAVFQLKRYVEELARKGHSVRGILVAEDISETAYAYLRRYGLEFRRFVKRTARLQ